MRLLLELDKDVPTLSLSEALTTTTATTHTLDENILLLETRQEHPEHLVKTLSLTRAVYHHLFTTKRKHLTKEIGLQHWNIQQPIKVETRHATPEERKKAITATCHALNNPTVSMNTPATTITYLYTKNNAHCGILIGEPEQDDSRAMRHLPAPHPSAMKPRIVRALINIAAPTKKIIDPFCGAGGFLAEAARLNIPVEGWDIDSGMLWRAKKNTQQYKNITLKKKDARTLTTADAILADLPYGRNTKQQNMTKLYNDFFKTLKTATFTKAVLILPNHARPAALARKKGLNITNMHTLFVHNKLTRIILEILPTKIQPKKPLKRKHS